MSVFRSCVLAIQYVIPGFFSILFRIYGLGVKNRRSLILGLGFYFGISLLFPTILMLQTSYEFYKQWVLLVMSVANLSVLLISSDNFQKTCFLHLSQVNIVFWISTAVGCIRRVCGLSYLASDLIRLLLSCAALYLGLRYCAKPMRFMADTIRTGWLALLTIPACILLACYITVIQFSVIQPYPAFWALIIITLIDISFILYMRRLHRSLIESEQLAKEQNRQSVLQAELLAYDDAVVAAKRSRHDIRHHNAVLLEYLHTGDLAGAESYLQSTDSQLLLPTLLQFCENHVANAFFRIYDRSCRQAGVTLTVEGNIPEQLPLSASETGALLGNLLENAFNACKQVELSPYIRAEFHVEDNILYGHIENSVSGKVDFSGGLPQSHRSGGGTGVKSIIKTLEQYGGAARWYQKRTSFHTQIVLPL